VTILVSTLRCPRCGATRDETMPIYTCRIRYDCQTCGAVLRPKPGDCCVFCSYGTQPCPYEQEVSAALGGEAVDQGDRL